MIISGISAPDLEAARDVASAALGNRLLFSEFESYRPRRHRIRLQVADIDGPGARRHSHMCLAGPMEKPRRSRFACVHAWGFLLTAVYEREPMAKARSALAYYRDVYDFLAKYPATFDINCGSRMLPLRLADECTCAGDDICDDTLRRWLWSEGGVAELPTPENMATVQGEEVNTQ
jgi:hypothetical protein